MASGHNLRCSTFHTIDHHTQKPVSSSCKHEYPSRPGHAPLIRACIVMQQQFQGQECVQQRLHFVRSQKVPRHQMTLPSVVPCLPSSSMLSTLWTITSIQNVILHVIPIRLGPDCLEVAYVVSGQPSKRIGFDADLVHRCRWDAVSPSPGSELSLLLCKCSTFRTFIVQH